MKNVIDNSLLDEDKMRYLVKHIVYCLVINPHYSE